MEGKIHTQNMDSRKILHPKTLESCVSPTQNMGENCVLVINLMARDYFWGITELIREKMTIVETFYPPKTMGSSYCKSQNGFQVKFQTQKRGKHTQHGKYPLSLFQADSRTKV